MLHFDRPSFTSQPLQLTLATRVAQEKRSLFSGRVAEISPAPEMPIMSYQDRGGLVNKILKQQCLLRLRLQVPDGDYGTVQIVVWPEIGGAVELWIRWRACWECKE